MFNQRPYGYQDVPLSVDDDSTNQNENLNNLNVAVAPETEQIDGNNSMFTDHQRRSALKNVGAFHPIGIRPVRFRLWRRNKGAIEMATAGVEKLFNVDVEKRKPVSNVTAFWTMTKARLRNGLKNFCEGTVMHGFGHLYKAKLVGRVFWLSLIIAALAIMSFQIYGCVEQFVNQLPSTSIETVFDEMSIVYPPLKFCLSHWTHWWIGNRFSLDPWGFFYAVSFLTPIYTKHHFNISYAEANFLQTYAKNFTNLQEFYLLNSVDLTDIKPRGLFTDKELLVLDDMIYLCYKANGSHVRSFVTQNSLSVHLPVAKNYFLSGEHEFAAIGYNVVNLDEMPFYMNDWCRSLQLACDTAYFYGILQTMQSSTIFAHSSVPDLRPVDVFIVDGYNNQNFKIAQEVAEYSVRLKSSVRVTRNTNAKPCKRNVKALFTKKVCEHQCQGFDCTYRTPSPCWTLATTVKRNESVPIGKLCRNKINFLGQPDPQLIDTYSNSEIECSHYDNRSVDACITNCSEGCEKWTFEMSVSANMYEINAKMQTITASRMVKINVQYPSIDDLLYFVEMDSKTWEYFVGNVGGLLGIWTGASILSIFQLFYLFCSVQR